MNDKSLQGIAAIDDDVSFYPADDAHLRSYQKAQETLAELRVPQLADPTNPHERIYIAAFDGTGNDKHLDPLHATNVARIDDQLKALSERDGQIHVRYLAGPGTQSNPLTRVADGALGYTYQQRLEEMYTDLVDKAAKWQKADPEVSIRVIGIGFSRGAS